MRSARGASTRGFTLLEMMVALLLLGLLAGLIFGGVQVATRSWEKVTLHAEQANETVLVQNFLRHLVEQVSAQQLRDQELVLQVAVHGQDNHLLFLAPRPHQSEMLAWFSLGLEQTPDGGSQLTLRTLPFQLADNREVDWADLELHLQQQAAKPDSALLSHEVAALQIDYLPREPEGIAQWQPEWLQQEQLPELIRLRFDPGAQVRQGEFDLVIAPREGRYVVKEAF